MLFRVDLGSATPLAEQIAGCVRRGLADGLLAPGDRLPTARGLAGSLGVNMHTVLRGYAMLQDDGLIELRRGRGATITRADPAGRARVTEAVRDLVALARRNGLGAEEVLELVRKELE